MQAEEEPQTP